MRRRLQAIVQLILLLLLTNQTRCAQYEIGMVNPLAKDNRNAVELGQPAAYCFEVAVDLLNGLNVTKVPDDLLYLTNMFPDDDITYDIRDSLSGK